MAKNVPEFDWRPLNAALGTLVSSAPELRARALLLAGEAINSEAQIDAPVKTGALKESHFVDDSGLPQNVRIGASIVYAAAVLVRHPSKAWWYLKAIVGKGPKIIEKAMRKAMSEVHPGSTSGGAA